MNFRIAASARASALAVLLMICPAIGLAQLTYTETFTGATTNNQWFFYNGACLTAGTTTSTTSPGYVPGCLTVLANYYYPVITSLGKTNSDSYLVGGDLGFLGGSAAPSSYTAQVPDLAPVSTNGNSGGALRFTNGSPYGYHENGAIVSDFVFPTAQGLEITFKTVTYGGDNQGGHGADGISFYLLDGCMPIAGGTIPSTGCGASTAYNTTTTGASNNGTTFSGIGAWGGSLAYSCSNNNQPYDGLAGGYLALGIDEWGNFLNGTSNTLNETGSTNTNGDNTASGGYYQPGRIGLRGAGNISWQTLNNAYGSYIGNTSPYYPASLTTSCYIEGGTYNSSTGLCSGGNTSTDAMMAVQETCANGTLYNFSSRGTVTSTSVKTPKSVGATALTNTKNTAGILDYAALQNGYEVVTGFSIANESATVRGSTLVANTSANDANPITYDLKITPTNLLSLSVSYNGGAFQSIITGQDITASNGTPPAWFRFGFAGSTGGSTNIHEILCFKAAPGNTSASSGGVNTFQNPQLNPGSTQVYLAYYNPSDWTGSLTATSVFFNTSTNSLAIATTPTWDARCVLTGASATTPCSTGSTSMSAEAPATRTMLTWNGSAGVAFEWGTGYLTSAQQTALTAGDSSETGNRLAYLRGTTTNYISSTGTCPQLTSPGLPCFRALDSVLGDIVDSSPTWVGPPQTYASTVTFADTLWASQDVPTETSYAAFMTGSAQTRANVVYVGANDGFVHGFRAGSMDAKGNLVTSTYADDGHEVLAYMPGAVLQTIHSTTAALDYSNVQYAHAWSVDATPVSGDLFYSGAWHTWLVGGLGPGGAAIYALDVTDPSTFSETTGTTTGPANTVIGEWSSANISCTNSVSNCGQYLGNTYGMPLIRRFHNGSWGVIFGNGYGHTSTTNTTLTSAAGIYIMLINPTTAATTFYYFATPTSNTTANGIANVASLDLDQDHIIDYIYAGDLQGNVWRFDVTDPSPTNWALSGKLFSTPNGQPITAGLTVSTLRQIDMTNLGGEILDTAKPARVVINFGTGQYTPLTVTTAAQYAPASQTQEMFGIWDANFGLAGTTGCGWNKNSNIPAVSNGLCPETMVAVSSGTLTQQTITTNTSGTLTYRVVSNNAVCWAVVEPLDASSSCTTHTQYGWYIQLPVSQEQIIFNPVISPDGELIFNTFIPSGDTPLSCATNDQSTGFTMGLDPATGGGTASATGTGGYFSVNTNSGLVGADGVQLNGTGIPWFISSGQQADNNSQYLFTQTSNGTAAPTKTNRHTVVSGKRLNWVQRR